MIIEQCLKLQTYSPYAEPKMIPIFGQKEVDFAAKVVADGEGEYRRMKASKEVYLIKTHNIPRDDGPAIFLHRDGRDAVASYARFKKMRPIDAIYGQQSEFPDWSRFYRAWDPANRPDTLATKFDILKNCPNAVATDIARFLGIKCCIGKFKNPKDHANKTWDRCFNQAPTKWRDHFSQDDTTAFWALHGDVMDELGYLRDSSERDEMNETNSMESVVVPKDKIKETAAAKRVIKLNLGCGDRPLDGYENRDIKGGFNAFPLIVDQDAIVEEIRASHILEHFGHRQIIDVLKNWYETIAPGGWLKVAVPDFGKIAGMYCDKKKVNALGYIMGGQTDDNDYHKCLFDKETLEKMMQCVGFKFVKEWDSETDDCASLDISLNLMGKKPEFSEGPAGQDAPPAVVRNGDIVTCNVDTSNTVALMSMPRLCFADNMFCALRAFTELKIDLRRGSGVFWNQVLTQMIEEQVALGKKYIITLDFDTWFTKEHVMMLLWLMEQNPDADAIIPVQIARERPEIMVGLDDENGKARTEVMSNEFEGALTPVVRGHFGLTIFRASAFEDLKKPWLDAKPDPDGGWGDHRQDADIAFWNNFAACGKKAYLSNDVSIGHLQMVCTWPGVSKDNWNPIHQYMFDLETNGPPDHCKPAVERT
jgi:predicted SAM-dependent methyltransferase